MGGHARAHACPGCTCMPRCTCMPTCILCMPCIPMPLAFDPCLPTSLTLRLLLRQELLCYLLPRSARSSPQTSPQTSPQSSGGSAGGSAGGSGASSASSSLHWFRGSLCHAPYFEDPEQYNRVLLAFLRAAPERPPALTHAVELEGGGSEKPEPVGARGGCSWGDHYLGF